MTRALLAAGLVAALALVAAAAAVSQRAAREAEVSPLPSVENTGPAGLAAARELLRSAGRGAVRLAGEGDVPPPGAVVVVAAPGTELDEREAGALLSHAERGGTVLLAAGRTRQPALERRLSGRLAAARGARTALPLAPHPLVAGLELPVGSGFVSSSRDGALPIAGRDGLLSAVSVPLGAGEVLLLSGPEPLTNSRLGEAGALSFLVRLADRGTVAFDERWLLPRGSAAPPSRVALGAFLAQALLAGATLVAARARRFGAVRPPPSEGPARTARDYLAALATLYRRAGAEREIATSAWRRARGRLERRAGIPAGMAAEAAVPRLRRRSEAAADALLRGEAALRGDRPLLEVGRAAADLERALPTGPANEL